MANVSINNITETWSSSGTTYTGIKYNVTDTASAAGSNLMDLQVGGLSRLVIDKNGSVTSNPSTLNGSFKTYNSVYANSSITYSGYTALSHSGANYVDIGPSWVTMRVCGGNVFLSGDAANTLAQRNGANAQSYRLYLSYTDATNNSRFAINATANYYRIASEIGTSTGAKKPIVTDVYSSTVDPTTTDIPDGTSTVWKNTTSGVVKLWVNNGGTLIGVALA